jgi:hypothetical protein
VIEEGKCNEEIEYKVYERNAKKGKRSETLLVEHIIVVGR